MISVMPQSKERISVVVWSLSYRGMVKELVYRGVSTALLIKYGMVSYLAHMQ